MSESNNDTNENTETDMFSDFKYVDDEQLAETEQIEPQTDENEPQDENDTRQRENPSAPKHKRFNPKNKWLLALVIVAVVCTGVGILASQFIISPDQQKMQSAPPVPTLITENVQYKKIANTIISRGAITPAKSYYVGHGALLRTGSVTGEGSPEILTAVNMKVGDQVWEGQAIAEIQERPLFIMQGEMTMYRDIEPDFIGEDVAQLQRSLARLGFYGGAINSTYDKATQDAVGRFYKDRGFIPQTVEVMPEETGENTNETANADNPNLMLPDKAQEAPTVPKTELVFIQEMPVHVTAVTNNIGFGTPQVVAILTPNALKLDVTIPSDQADLVHNGLEADIYLTEDNPVKGTITHISKGSASDDQTKSATSVELTVTPNDPLDFTRSGENVKVIFHAASTKNEVLAVPLGAISSDSAGETFVMVVGEKDELTEVAVKIGVSGDGLVEVTPKTEGALKKDDKVLIGR
ncbi:MAG: HlyD family efflux transporter periplasmic adaptor subunit [Bifidobacteriaceae bacterium]|jgi:multidrug efflux pump subunit AcrA (membrane-fusion protein)|nr:HlyD family efflux transporter periplasmic adaptor subunit [Bifidobacteriaceae bacterium]